MGRNLSSAAHFKVSAPCFSTSPIRGHHFRRHSSAATIRCETEIVHSSRAHEAKLLFGNLRDHGWRRNLCRLTRCEHPISASFESGRVVNERAWFEAFCAIVTELPTAGHSSTRGRKGSEALIEAALRDKVLQARFVRGAADLEFIGAFRKIQGRKAL